MRFGPGGGRPSRRCRGEGTCEGSLAAGRGQLPRPLAPVVRGRRIGGRAGGGRVARVTGRLYPASAHRGLGLPPRGGRGIRQRDAVGVPALGGAAGRRRRGGVRGGFGEVAGPGGRRARNRRGHPTASSWRSPSPAPSASTTRHRPPTSSNPTRGCCRARTPAGSCPRRLRRNCVIRGRLGRAPVRSSIPPCQPMPKAPRGGAGEPMAVVSVTTGWPAAKAVSSGPVRTTAG